MDEETSAAVKRAYECIDVLNLVTKNLDADPPRVDGDANAIEMATQFGADGVPIEIRSAIDSAVCAIMGVLAAAQPNVQGRVTHRPPEWWGDVVNSLRAQANKNASATRLFNTLLIFEPYLDENTSADLILFILVASDKDRKLRIDRVRQGLRAVGKPHAQHTIVIFDPEIDEDVRYALHEACGEVLAFSERCEALLGRALGDIAALVE